ncbi:MAG: hypothetical protein EOM26_03010 [Alphaproteobacteria bacterium]|nr:hypothetical protein [Alphaproteobacteria bacterium]
MDDNPKRINCWIVTEGIAGTENQCLGVAEALGLRPEVRRVNLNPPWKQLSPALPFETGATFTPRLSPPWPDLLIASGRKSVAAARYIKRMSGGRTFTVQIQDPRAPASQFDLVAVPEHDRLRGGNVIVTAATPNRITPGRLAEAKAAFSQFENIKRPRAAVLIGGTSKSYTMTADIMRSIAHNLKMAEAGLMVTASRRTGDANRHILEQALEGTDAWLWDGTGENPYFGLLAWADIILVTADSSSMLSEAATTGKPVYLLPLEGGSPKFDRLHENLIRRGALRRFEGKIETWEYEPLGDAQFVANEIANRLNASR